MKIIQDKKLFGKINLFDILVVLILALVAAFAYNYLYPSASKGVSTTYFDTTCKVKLDNLPIGVYEGVNVGDLIYDNETNLYIGKVVDAEKVEYKKVIEDYENNKFVNAVVPDRETVILTIAVSVNDTDADLITANTYYIKVGKELHLRGPGYAGGGYIISIERR